MLSYLIITMRQEKQFTRVQRNKVDCFRFAKISEEKSQRLSTLFFATTRKILFMSYSTRLYVNKHLIYKLYIKIHINWLQTNITLLSFAMNFSSLIHQRETTILTNQKRLFTGQVARNNTQDIFEKSLGKLFWFEVTIFLLIAKRFLLCGLFLFKSC